MDGANISQLIAPETVLVENRRHIQGPENEPEFLSLKLLNKRSRVRLSPVGIDCVRLPGKASLLAVGNKKGWFAAAVRKEDDTNHILVSNLGDLRTAFESGNGDSEPFIPFTARHSFSVPGTPTIIRFALNDERLVIGFLEGPILVYQTDEFIESTQNNQPNPIYSFPGDFSTVPREILPNPGESPELVVMMRGVHGREPGHQIDVIDVRQLKVVAGWRRGNHPDSVPVSISWSPKGKQIAIGLQSGDMLLYNPLDAGNPKSHLLKPPSAPVSTSSLIATTWLSTAVFHTVFSSPEASSILFDLSTSEPPEQIHFVSMHDSKSKSAIDVELRDPCPPFGAKRPPGPLSVVLRNWSPTKFIIFCGDGPSSDIGVMGTLPDPSNPSEDVWANFNLEETSTPSLPLEENLNDPALLGLEIDLTSSKPVRMSEQADDGTPDLPPSPILYAYTSEGTIVAWHILNNKGEAYPGMMATGETDTSIVASSTPRQQGSVQTFGMPSPRVSPPASPTPTSTPLFRPAQAFGSSTPSAPAFGAASSPSTGTNSASGFGFYSNANLTSKFGSTGFGFGTSTASSPLGQPPTVPAFSSTGSEGSPSQTEKQTPAALPAFGTTGFGQTSTMPTFGTSGFGSKPATAPAFGQPAFSAVSPAPAKPTSGVGSFSGGFASFANQGSSAFVAPASSSSTSEPKPQATSVFGQGLATSPSASRSAFGAGGQGQASSTPSSAFGSGGAGQAFKTAAPPVTAFGQSSLQRDPAFGASGQKATTPAFGKTGFGNAPSPSPPQSGAFGSFGTLGNALKPAASSARLDSPPGSPLNESPPSSPEMRASSQPMKPTSSYVKPAGGFGSWIKPAEGFGAFGGTTSSSPVIKSGEGFGSSSQRNPVASAFAQSKPSVPTFGSAGFSPSATSSGNSATPTFGSTSALGQKPVFGTGSFGTVRPAVVEPSKPITGGFSAFSSGGGGFASFANTSKSVSFTDILASGDPDKSKLGAAEAPALGGTSAIKNPGALAFGLPKEPGLSSSPSPGKSTAAFSTPDSGTKGIEENEEDEAGRKRFPTDDEEEGPSLSSGGGEDSSFSLLSLKDAASHAASSSSAFTPATSTGEREATESEPDSVGKGDHDPEGEETPSEPFSLTDGESDESEPGGDEHLPRSPTRSLSEDEAEEPAQIPLPETPHEQTPRPTPTPTPEPSKHQTTPEVAVSSPPPEPSTTSGIDETDTSTTPPGSPKKPAITTQPTLSAPVATKPALSTPTSSPFGLGLGRPSSRPIRSSPLASAPITNAEEEPHDVTPAKSTPADAIFEDLQPQSPFPPPISISAPARPTGPDDGPGTSKPRRPKTPPFLGTSTSAQGVQPMPLGGPFVLGQPQVTPAPLNIPVRSVQPVTPPTASAPSQLVPTDEQIEIPKHPMQVEFLRACQEMTNELARLYTKARDIATLWPIISEPRGLNKLVINNQDFLPGKYSLGDLKAFTTMISVLQKRVLPLLEQGRANKLLLQDLQNLALISETKQEEISRWVRARQDPEFAKTLKPHTLGPEHSENQTRLRKALQAARDRIQQCEDEMESLKRRLEQHKSGKVGLRPPSLDTIDRTCRNIQLALEERIKLLERLHGRIEALSPKASERLRSSQGHSALPLSSPHSVTPPFASVAAAALNSERSSLKLKNALLSGRKEPLFTNRSSKFELVRPGAQNTHVPSQVPRPEWKLPPVPPIDTPSSSSFSSPSVSRRGGRTTGKRHGAVQFNPTTLNSNTKPIAFDWGPLPGAAPMQKLSFDVRSQKGKGKADLEWDQEATEDCEPR